MEQTPGISIPLLRANDGAQIQEISNVMDRLPPIPIRYSPWPGPVELPKAAFVMAHGQQAIHLKYYINEPTIKAEYLNFNDPVFKDSCVEFFVAFDDDPKYYNLEFNCVGTCRGQYGISKTEREFLPPSLLGTIKHQTCIKGRGNEQIEWELTLTIPLEVFRYHPGLSLETCKAKGNFYKCGDGLPEPHYLCWSNISAAYPEFHLTDFFKEIKFEGNED
jgi:hypothetical protein